jgi:hypothetical protein
MESALGSTVSLLGLFPRLKKENMREGFSSLTRDTADSLASHDRDITPSVLLSVSPASFSRLRAALRVFNAIIGRLLLLKRVGSFENC